MASSHFSPEDIGIFNQTLQGLDHAQIVQAKELYLRNAIVEYKSSYAQLKRNKWFKFVPVFWIFLSTADVKFDEQLAKIKNALQVWKEDLVYSYQEFESEIEALEALPPIRKNHRKAF